MSDKMRALCVEQIKAKMAQVNQRLQTIENPKSFDQIVTHMDSILLLVGQMVEFEKQYPNIMEPSPKDLYPMMEKSKDIKLATFALKIADLNIEKAKVVSKATTKTSLLDEAKMMVVEAKSLVKNEEFAGKLEAKLAELTNMS